LIDVRLRFPISDAREGWSISWKACRQLCSLFDEPPIELRAHTRCNRGAVSLKIGVVNLHVCRWRGPRIFFFGERVTAEANNL
jgi:hypothetical protein